MGTTKCCCRCYTIHTIENFKKNNSTVDKLDPWCNRCRKTYDGKSVYRVYQENDRKVQSKPSKFLTAREIKATTGIAPIMGRALWMRLRNAGTLNIKLRSLYIRQGTDEEGDRVRKLNRRRNKKADLSLLKCERGCTDCGYNAHPEALHFDHLPEYPKSFAISASRHSWERIMGEVAKCEVVCSNCHAIRTYARREARDLI